MAIFFKILIQVCCEIELNIGYDPFAHCNQAMILHMISGIYVVFYSYSYSSHFFFNFQLNYAALCFGKYRCLLFQTRSSLLSSYTPRKDNLQKINLNYITL